MSATTTIVVNQRAIEVPVSIFWSSDFGGPFPDDIVRGAVAVRRQLCRRTGVRGRDRADALAVFEADLRAVVAGGCAMSERVNHPAHYAGGGIEVIDAIEAWGLNFHLGNVVKYVARCDSKGDALEDLRKARWYLDREIERREDRVPAVSGCRECGAVDPCVHDAGGGR